jgi:hypothetical protein
MTPKDFKTDVTLSRRIGDYKEAQSMLFDDQSIRIILEAHPNSSIQPRLRIKFAHQTDCHSRHAAPKHRPHNQKKNVPFTNSGSFCCRQRKHSDAQ